MRRALRLLRQLNRARRHLADAVASGDAGAVRNVRELAAHYAAELARFDVRVGRARAERGHSFQGAQGEGGE